MIADLKTMLWKERKGLLRYRGSRTRFLLTLMTPVLMAVVMPWQEGAGWVESPISLIISLAIPIIIVGITVPESFAGERERHTLETLLASRLPDRAILFGKLTTAVAFAWGLTLAVLLMSLVPVNLAHGEGKILFFTPTLALGNLALSFVLSTLCASAGVLVSLRSETVQEAAQTLMAIFLVPPMILQMVLFMFVDQLRDTLQNLNGEQVLLIIIVVLAVIDLAVSALAVARFRRSRLHLS
jgi:ABC-2 type transport system permease protein